MKAEDTLNAARAILPHLKTLLDTIQAKKINSELTALLERDKAGEDVELEIIDVLGKHKSTHNWKNNFLKNKSSDGIKNYTPLSENIGQPHTKHPAVALSPHFCPRPPCDCEYSNGWTPFAGGQEIPLCPKNKQPLKPEQ